MKSHFRPIVIGLVFCPLFRVATLRADDMLAKSIEVEAKLKKREKLKGFTDQKATFGDALKSLGRDLGVTITINDKAFKYEQLTDVSLTPISEIEIPGFTGPPALMLNKLLAKIPVPSGAVFFVRGDTIEVTTQKFLIDEFYPNHSVALLAPLPPLVHASFEKVSLENALKKLADMTDMNIVLDSGAAKDIKTTVTADFRNAPLDKAVTLLADMCGLSCVSVGNIYYVTTPEKASRLAQAKRAKKAK